MCMFASLHKVETHHDMFIDHDTSPPNGTWLSSVLQFYVIGKECNVRRILYVAR